MSAAEATRPAEAALIGVVSGKGGVGKTNLVANVAVACRALGARVLVVDGDLGLANLDVLLGLTPRLSSADVLAGRCSLEEAIVEGPRGIHVLPAASGSGDLAGLRPRELAALLVPLFRASGRYELVLLDAGAGLGASVLSLAASCDRLLLVTTPEPTSLADAYATLKVIGREAPLLPMDLVVNGVRSAADAQRTHARLAKLAQRFLSWSPPLLGHLPSDPRLAAAVARQRAVVEAFPNAPVSRALVQLAQALLRAPKSRLSESEAVAET
jgi:flagellar biosynthesis protein FlhG